MPQRGGFSLCVLYVLWDSHVTPPRAPAAHGERPCEGHLLWPIPRGAQCGTHVSLAQRSARSCGHSGAPRATGQLVGMKVTQDQGRGTRLSCAAGRARLRPACPPRPVGAAAPNLLLVTWWGARRWGGGVVGRPGRPLPRSPAPTPLRAVQPPGRGGGLTVCPMPLQSTVGVDEPRGRQAAAYPPCSPAPWSSPPAWRSAPCCG